jgi:dolichyl-phosphooligosaccharide-protein glycotransferase
MEPSHTGWWSRHGWTVSLLLVAFSSAFAIRTLWAYPVVAQWGPLFTYAGGSDSYYHSRVMTYIVQNHTNLIHDPMLKFPVGAINPREPLFDWMNAILGIVFAPFFGGNAVVAGAWFLDLQPPLWAALGVFPVYLIGREVATRRTGLIAALIFPFLSANIDSSIFGYANYLPFYTFFILVVVYSYIRTVKAVGNRRWVESYRRPREFLPALRAFAQTERTAVKWAVFTGVSLGALALAWQGFTYAVVVISVSLLVAMIVERIRRVDSFGLYVATWIVGLVGFPMAMPYYIVQQQFAVWFDLPLLLYFGVLALLLPFLLMRDLPWVFSLPILVALVVGAAGALALVSPSYFTSIVTGQGYFVKNLIYSTVAEAQAPNIDQLVVGYGVVTFFLAFVGLALFVYLLIRGRFKRYHVVFLVFAVLSIYLPISAAKFFLVGSPIFALLPAEAIRRALEVGGYPELRRTVASLSDRRSQFAAFRKAFKARHVLIMALVVGLILPNIWVAIDAGIPGNAKTQFADQVQATLPSWLQPAGSNSAQYYFGAAGSSLDTPNQYDSAGYNWLAQQDTATPPAQRPAFVSWWDYGFQAIAQGDHPSVADNFQNGIDPAGQFLLSQNESQAIGVLITTLLQAEQKKTGAPYLPGSLDQVLAQDGLNVGQLNSLLHNTSADYTLVVAHPDRYLPVNPSALTADNAMYLAVEYFLATSLPLSGVAKVYNDVQLYTGWSIRYAMSDSRLFPFYGYDTGIFYAPADLTGRVVNAAGLPTTFFNVTILGSDGNTYPAGQLPANVAAVNYTINYFAPFYNSMIYHIYIGYNGTDAGLGPGIPGLEGSQATVSAPLMPGWMLQHFEVVYKTGYYCPQPNQTAGASCFAATNAPEAVAQAARTHGSADTSAGSYFGGGESMLAYYAGQPFLGDLTLPSGTPVAGADVTVDDGWGIPHMTTVTAKDGSFSLILPPGNDTVNITMGSFNALRQQGNVLLKSLAIPVSNAVGFSFNAPSIVESIQLPPAKVQGFVYWNSNNSTGYAPAEDPLIPNAQVTLWGPNGLSRLTMTTDASGSFAFSNVPPGVYNYNVVYGGTNFTEATVTAQPGSTYNATVGLLPGFFSGTVRTADGTPVAGSTVTLGNSTGTVATTTSNATGKYEIRSTGPGNYSLTAAGPIAGYRSPGIPVSAPSPGSAVKTNLTIAPTNSFSLTLVSNGAPAAGIPVRFVPIASYASPSLPPIAALRDAAANGTVLVSSSSGTVTAALPTGAYSVYALGYVGSTLEAAVTDIAVSPLSPPIGPLVVLSPAVGLNGTVASVGPSSGSSQTAVIAYAAMGGEAVTWSKNGSFSLLLPSGTYSLLSISGTGSAGSSVSTSLLSVPLVEPTTVHLAPVNAVASRFTVGSVLSNGSIFPAGSALVSVLVGPNGPSIPVIASAAGVVEVYAPSTLENSATYCVAAQSAGFVPSETCGISPNGLEQLNRFPLSLASVSVRLSVLGLPAGTPVSVNLTAESPTAENRTLYGGPSFAFTLPPGVYGVGARATIANGTVVYLPSSTILTTIPFGAVNSNLTLLLVPEVTAKGTLHLGVSVPLANVTVVLSSPVLNVTVTGAEFTNGFYATPGTYSAYANFTARGVTYVNLTRVAVATDGTVSPALTVNAAAVTLNGTFTNPSGGTVALNTTVTLAAPDGARTTVRSSSGTFSLELPPSTTYEVFANATLLTSGPNGSFYQSWSVVPGSRCTPTVSAPECPVPVVPTTELVTLGGSLSSAGVPGLLAGTVVLMGPYPSQNLTSVSAPSGSFSVRLLPGAYSVYANSGSGSAARAAFEAVTALPSTTGPLALSLVPTWLATISIAGPNGSVAGLGPVTITLRNAFGNSLVFSGVAPSSNVSIALPTGTYGVSAEALGSLSGIPATASGTATVTVVNGNVATVVPLAYVRSALVHGTLLGPSTVTVRAGGVASFAFSVRATGNVPVTIHPVGTPSYWTFTFSFSNATLVPGPSGTNLSGEVSFRVPAGTGTAHPSVDLEFALADGTVIGSVSPAPTVNVLPYYGVMIGPSSAPGQVGVSKVLEPIYVLNTGNTFETVFLTVVNAPQLASLGWTATVGRTANSTSNLAGLSVGENVTYFVKLNATGSVFLAPGSVTVSASVANASGSITSTTVLTVAPGVLKPSVPPGGSAVTVTGPSIGPPSTALPDWVVAILSFVPAIALVAGVLTYRWWRTRRWTRR